MPAANLQNPWGPEHTDALARSMIQVILSHRSDIYRDPALANVAYNGGSRINQKCQQLLHKMCADLGGKAFVDEQVATMGGGKGKGKGKGTGVGGAGSPGKKRKVEDDDEEAEAVKSEL